MFIHSYETLLVSLISRWLSPRAPLLTTTCRRVAAGRAAVALMFVLSETEQQRMAPQFLFLFFFPSCNTFQQPIFTSIKFEKHSGGEKCKFQTPARGGDYGLFSTMHPATGAGFLGQLESDAALTLSCNQPGKLHCRPISDLPPKYSNLTIEYHTTITHQKYAW